MQEIGSRRSQQLRRMLAERFDLGEEVVSAGLVVAVEAIRDRIPRAAEISLISWIPEAWFILGGGEGTAGTCSACPCRGKEALIGRLAKVGVPEESGLEFVATLIAFIGDRCGSALARSIRRRVPEIDGVEVGRLRCCVEGGENQAEATAV